MAATSVRIRADLGTQAVALDDLLVVLRTIAEIVPEDTKVMIGTGSFAFAAVAISDLTIPEYEGEPDA